MTATTLRRRTGLRTALVALVGSATLVPAVSAASADEIVPVCAIQGDGATSPMAGQVVTTTGVVTAHDAGGFWLQQPDCDGDPATSDGIYVFAFFDDDYPDVGDAADVEGVVGERFGSTQLRRFEATVVAEGVGVPDPVAIIPARARAQGPDQAYYESLEHMRVRLASATTYVGTNRFGESFLVPGHTKERVRRTDDRYDLLALDGDVGGTVNTFAFDHVVGAVGPLSFSFNNYKLLPESADDVKVTRPRAERHQRPQPVVPLDGSLTVATFNLFNVFDEVEDGGPATPEPSPAEQQVKRSKIAHAVDEWLGTPAVIAAQEVEKLHLLEAIAEEIDDLTGGATDYEAVLLEGNDVRGIDVGFLVDVERVSYDNVRQLAPGAVSDGRCQAGASGDLVYDRVPLAIDVATSAGPVTFVSVHFKSKFGGTEENDFFEDCRVEQAETLLAELDGTTRAVVLGDVNAFRDSDTLATFAAGGYANVVDRIPEDRRFSYVFEGRVQFLDHVLVSSSLTDAVVDVDSPKVDSDVPFPLFEDDATSGLAVSDHDPLLAGFAFGAVPAPAGDAVTIQLLSVSDWHGQVEPLSVFGVGTIGGAAVIDAYWDADRAELPNTLTLTAGDAFGASPPLSSFFDEEPAVRAMNMMGFDVDTLGNHNFDAGIDHLQSMIDLAGFDYVSANLANVDENLDGVAPWRIYDVGGVDVGVVGITNPEAPTLVFPGSFGTIEVTDPVAAANKAKAEAKRAGADVLVLITHMGVEGFDADGEPFGALIDLAENVGGFDVILGDHTDVQFEGVINNALVVENRSRGRTYARTLLEVDPRNGRVIDRGVEFVVPFADDVTPDPAIEAMLDGYREELAPIFNTVVGESTTRVPRGDACGHSSGRTCESLVGNLVTDSMRVTYGTDVALTNAGGLRDDLTCPETDQSGDFCPSFTPPPYPVTRGQVQAVLPFGNQVVTLSVTGSELHAMLEHGLGAMPAANGRFPQVSGMCVTYDISAPAGDRITRLVRQAPDGSCTGAAIDPSATYSLATNDFLASGGDEYPDVMSRAVTRDLMDQVLADHLRTVATVSPSIQGRIRCTSSGTTACPTVAP